MILEKSLNLQSLETSIQYLKGVGPRLSLKFQKLGIETIEDLLLHIPRRYQDRTHITPIRHLQVGKEAVVQGKINWIEKIEKRKRAQCIICVEDSTGEIWLHFFQVYPGLENKLKVGVTLRAFGEVRWYQRHKEMVHPEYQVSQGSEAPIEEHLTPVYPATEGLSQKKIRSSVAQALSMLRKQGEASEYLPNTIGMLNQPFTKWADAVTYLHAPPPDTDKALLQCKEHPAFLRLALEELITHTACLLTLRADRKKSSAFILNGDKDLKKTFLETLPFTLTGAQARVVAEVERNLKEPLATARLIQGDVGCGKTVVAAIALLQAVSSGYQGALMAPTELVAEQHYQNFCCWFKPLGVSVYLLCNKTSASDRKPILNDLEIGKPLVLIGTHAIFQEKVQFKKLALIVIDEQHRFGVEQRLALFNKGKKGEEVPHQLMVTATPIPRSLAMAAYADLDYSAIDELPPDRTPITTVVLPETRREEVISRIQTILAKSQQIYWVCALIEESEATGCQAAGITFSYLQQLLPNAHIGFIHGRMRATERDGIMQDFKAGKCAVLVATTVVEVGVDVPNATLMVIENAERMGLAQIHQLRGRVGRGQSSGYCLLLYRGPLSEIAMQRLEAIRHSQNGFEIAEKDLHLRGPGELLGTEQSGTADYRLVDFAHHQPLLPEAQRIANVLLREHPTRIPLLSRRWLKSRQGFRQV